jgi:flagellar assembly protein FliH
MSSSPRRAPAMAPAHKHTDIYKDRDNKYKDKLPPGPDVRAFPYDAVSLDATPPQSLFDAFGKAGAADASVAEVAAREKRARSQGREEGQAEARQQFAAQLERERSNIAAAVAEFARDRVTYFQKVEGEVVQLALSIARKILHREAQLDPMLLAGIVRVALEKIDGATRVTVRVHPQYAADWRRYLAAHLDPSRLPQIVEDPLQAVDSCILETSMGTAVVGAEVQLKEIEQGLTDLLASRPGIADSSVPPRVQSSQVPSRVQS